jgi:multiple antibiotic resistance protein
MFEGRDFAQGVLLVIGALLPIVNPVGNAPVFLAMTATADLATRARLARKIAINGFMLLMGSLFFGNLLLEFFGVSIPAVQVAGGCLVCKLGWSMLDETNDDVAAATATTTVDAHDARAFYPLTLPLTVGPGAIAVAVTIGANFPSTVQPYIADAASAILGALVVCITIYACYRYAQRLGDLVGTNGTVVLMRLSAFIMLCIGVQITWNGASTLIRDFHAPPAITTPARAG